MLKLMYITNDPQVAKIAEKSGVDRIFVDLEQLYKQQRQGGMDTVQSRHTLGDVALLRSVLTSAELLVRTNPIHDGSKEEIEQVIANGADMVMLPYFKTPGEVRDFIGYVAGRAKVSLLVETAEAVGAIDDILSIAGIDEIHIGLNDLHLSYGMDFMFELLADGTVEMLCRKFRNKGIPYGFGGIARIGTGTLPAEMIIREHYRLGSDCVILSRSFCNTDIVTDPGEVEKLFAEGLMEIRALEETLINGDEWLENNRQEVITIVGEIVKAKRTT